MNMKCTLTSWSFFCRAPFTDQNTFIFWRASGP